MGQHFFQFTESIQMEGNQPKNTQPKQKNKYTRKEI